MSLSPEIGSLQRPVVGLVRPPLSLFFALEVHGAENVPRRGPAILAPKHESMWDVPFVAVASPRTVLFMAKEAVFDNPLKRSVFTALGGFPVRGAERDASAIRTARAVLRSGRVLGLFPEGTRHPGSVGPLHSGAARLALATGAPLLPVGLHGTSEIWSGLGLRPVRVTVRFGLPMPPPPEGSSKERATALTARLAEEIERLSRPGADP